MNVASILNIANVVRPGEFVFSANSGMLLHEKQMVVAIHRGNSVENDVMWG